MFNTQYLLNLHVRPPTRPPVRSFVRPFVRSFVRLFDTTVFSISCSVFVLFFQQFTVCVGHLALKLDSVYSTLFRFISIQFVF